MLIMKTVKQHRMIDGKYEAFESTCFFKLKKIMLTRLCCYAKLDGREK